VADKENPSILYPTSVLGLKDWIGYYAWDLILAPGENNSNLFIATGVKRVYVVDFINYNYTIIYTYKDAYYLNLHPNGETLYVS